MLCRCVPLLRYRFPYIHQMQLGVRLRYLPPLKRWFFLSRLSIQITRLFGLLQISNILALYPSLRLRLQLAGIGIYVSRATLIRNIASVNVHCRRYVRLYLRQLLRKNYMSLRCEAFSASLDAPPCFLSVTKKEQQIGPQAIQRGFCYFHAMTR